MNKLNENLKVLIFVVIEIKLLTYFWFSFLIHKFKYISFFLLDLIKLFTSHYMY